MDKRDEQSIDALKLYYPAGLESSWNRRPFGHRVPQSPNSSAHGRDRGFVTISAMITVGPLSWLPVWAMRIILRARRAQAP